jgi:hypothetical protein
LDLAYLYLYEKYQEFKYVMDSKLLVGLIAVISIVIVIYFVSCSGKGGSSVEVIEYPPFTIKKKNSYGSRFDINTNSRRDDSRSNYSIYYKDKEVVLPEILNKNTGVPGLWKAYILNDAPQPTLLVGSKSVYLITEENHQAKITPVSEGKSDFASFQWLDIQQGQPGHKEELYASDDTDKSCKYSGGRYLLVNRDVVLDIQTLSLFPFQIRGSQTNEFYSNHVIGFSPDHEKIVFMASKYVGEDQFAIVTCQYKTNDSRAILFNRTETRLHEPYEADSEWLSTYFEWIEVAPGSFELSKIQYETLPPWEGYFERQGKYALSPVKVEMLDVFANFIKEYLQIPDHDVRRSAYADQRNYNFNVGENEVKLSFLSGQTVYFSDSISDKDEEGCKKIFKRVGEAFNKKLRNGEYQSLFTSY